MAILLIILPLVSASNLNCANPSCTSCTTGYLYRNISCLSTCPENSIISGSSCEIQSDEPFIKLDFSIFFSYGSSKIGDFEHPDGLAFQDSNKKSPIPTNSQGFYFTTTSRLVSTKNWVLAPSFTLEFYIKVNTQGTIFTISLSSSQFFICYVTSGYIVGSMFFLQNGSWLNKFVYTTINSNWKIFRMAVDQNLGFTRMWLFNSIFHTVQNAEFPAIDNLKYTLGHQTSSFKGFLYYFFMNNALYYSLNPTIFPKECNYFEYYDLYTGICTGCPSGCPDWPWCIRSGSCNTCYDTACSSCTGFSISYCDACYNSYAPPYCSLAQNCASGNIFHCSVCNSGYYLISGLCIHPPYNYNPSSTIPVIDLKFDEYSQYYGIFYSGASSATYAPYNMESDDPYPVYNRGLYFDSNDILTSNVELSLNCEFSIAIWYYKTELVIGSLFVGSNLMISDTSVSIIYLMDYEEYSGFITKTVDSSYGTWSYLTVSLHFDGLATSFVLGYNNTQYIDNTIDGYYFYNPPSYYKIGEVYNIFSNYKGFIYSFTIWQYYKTDFLAEFYPCASTFSCLWVISLNYYSNEYESKGMSCDFSCTKGCKTWGTCNQCNSIKCSSCSSYYSACTEDLVSPCLSGYHLTSLNKCCDLKCTDCYGPGYYRCFECDSGFFHLGNLCLDFCPDFIESKGTECEIENELIIKLSFDTISNEIEDSINQVKFVSGNSAEFWPHIEDADPIPAYKRGYYFAHGSFVASEAFSMSHNISIVIFVKVNEPGIIFTKDTAMLKTDDIFSNFTLGQYVFEFYAIPKGTWCVFVLQIYSDIDGYMTVNFQIKGTDLNSLITNAENLFIDTKSALIFGHSSQSFTGFLWEMQLFYSIYSLDSVDIAICLDSDSAECVWDCEINEYLLLTTCTSCLSECSTGCKSYKNCNICNFAFCTTCSNYKTCGNCPSNSEATDTGCVCNEGYQMKNSICEYCNYYIESFCVPICPIGYYNEGRKCLVKNENGLAIRFNFDKPVSIFYDKLSEISAVIIDESELYPAYSRGIYFTGNYSALILPNIPNSKLVFGIKFYLCFWLYPEESGIVLNKKTAEGELIQVNLDSFEMIISIKLNSDKILNRAEYKIKKETWNHIIIALENNGVSELTLYINGQLENSQQSSDYLSDSVNGGIVLGSYTNQSFTGFIYSFELWVKHPEFYELFKQPCKKCNICPVSGVCLSNCSISMYNLDNSCGTCLEECSRGCRQGVNCSLCADEQCIYCETYKKKSCLECSYGYILNKDSCIPCKEGFFYEQSTKSCESCKKPCKTCTSNLNCDTCLESSILINNTCECIEGYYQDNGCVRKQFSCVLKITETNKFNLLFTEEINRSLKKEDILVKIDEKIVEFDLEKISGFEYQIKIQGEVFNKKKKLVVYFENQIISKKNSLLGLNKLEATTFTNKTSNYNSPLALIENHTSNLFLASVGVIAVFSLININPKSLYTFLNSAELFSYTILYNVELDNELMTFLKSILITTNAPSIFDLMNIEKYQISDPKLDYFGFHTIFIYKTSGFFITTLVLILILNFILKCFEFIPVCQRALGYFKYKVYLRYWIQTLFELFFGSLIALKYLKYNGFQQIANVILCLIIIVLFIKGAQAMSFTALVHAVWKRSRLSNEQEIKKFQGEFGELFEEFKEDGISCWLFYLIFSIRRYAISVLIMFIDAPAVQLSVSITLSLGLLFYVFYSRCYKSKMLEFYFIYCELCVFIFYLLVFLSTFPGLKSNKKIIYACIVIILSVLLLALLSSLISSIFSIVKLCKKRKFKIGISPPSNDPEFRDDYKNESASIFQYVNSLRSPSASASFNPSHKFFDEKPIQNSIVSVEEINNE